MLWACPTRNVDSTIRVTQQEARKRDDTNTRFTAPPNRAEKSFKRQSLLIFFKVSSRAEAKQV